MKPSNKKFIIRKVHKKTKTEFSGEYKGREIDIQRDDNGEWYIIVTDIESGMHDYDGWWRDSDDKTINEAIEEALRGSMLI